MIRARDDYITTGYYRNIFNDILFQNTIISLAIL